MNKMDKAMEQKNADRPVALKVEHVSKNFKLPVERAGSLKTIRCKRQSINSSAEMIRTEQAC